LLEAARLISAMGANEIVANVIPDHLAGERNLEDTLQILKGMTRNWHMKENILFQVWTLKQAYGITDEEINTFWPEWYTRAVVKGSAAAVEEGAPHEAAGE
jgi:hypothetical protein